MNTPGDYAVLASAQKITHTEGSADDFNWLTDQKPGIDLDTDNKFRKYLDAIPYIDGAPEDLKLIATWRLAAAWFADNKDFTSAKYWNDEADKKSNNVIDSAKAQSDVNSRQKSLVVGNDPRNAKMPLPSQASIFVFDEFA